MSENNVKKRTGLEIYEKLASLSLAKKSWQDELACGCIVFDIAKIKGMTYEQSFDRMMSHFENAYVSAPADSKDVVLDISAKFVDDNIRLIETVLIENNNKRIENDSELFKIGFKVLKDIASDLKEKKDTIITIFTTGSPTEIANLSIDILPTIVNSTESIAENLFQGISIKKLSTECYRTLSRIFMKLACSKKMDLTSKLKSVFQRNKVDILRYIVVNGTVSEASYLVEFESDSAMDMYVSARIITETLCDCERWYEAESFLTDKSIRKMFEKRDYRNLWNIYENKKLSK